MNAREPQVAAAEPVGGSAPQGTYGAQPRADSAPKAPGTGQGGRYRWAILLGLLGLAGGASAGWMSKEPIYRAEALVYIEPTMPSVQDPTGKEVLPIFKGFVAFQVQLLKSPRLAQLAMESEAWGKTGKGRSPEAMATFTERRSILHEKDTQHIQIRFEDERPDVALAGVRAMTEAYEKLSVRENAGDERLRYVTAQIELLRAQLNEATDPRQKEVFAKKLDEMKTMKEQLEAQLVGKGRIKLADAGSLPTAPSEDSRQRLAAIFGAVGCLAGGLVGLLLGLRNRTSA